MGVDMATVFQLGVLVVMVAQIMSHNEHRHLSEDKYERKERLVAQIDELLRDLGNDLDKIGQKAPVETDDNENEGKARWWLKEYDKEGSRRMNVITNLEWNYETDISDENSRKYADMSVKLAQWSQIQSKKASEFIKAGHIADSNVMRQLKKIAMTANPTDPEKLKQLKDTANKLSKLYGTVKACNKTKCYSGEPDLEHVMQKSRDYYQLLWSWKEWRAVTGPKMRPLYEEFVALMNGGAREHEYDDMNEYWSKANYEQSNSDLSAMVDELWEEVRPMYEQLHAYVRRKLKAKYPMADIKDGGLIPAHLLGNMWAQQWDQIFDIVAPYPESPTVDVTEEMVRQKYDPVRMFATSEKFFTSIGLPRMTREFWERSMIIKPKDRDVQCHGSASDFSNGQDFRIKMCTHVTMDDLKTIHHEMGHVQYYMAYKDQPLVYREGANSAFHEAIGDTIALSVMTPEHFSKIKLMKAQGAVDQEQLKKMDINFLMSQALFKIAFLPFGLLIDKWRWGVFKGDITSANYNRKWWELRSKYQGIEPPVPRSEKDFDPGAKYHIPSNTPYIRYFLSFLVQFQFHSALCDAAGYKGPLHHCDIYESKEAGQRLHNMLELGSSMPWPDALKTLTGQGKIDTSKITEYFKPLIEWLERENGNDVGWHVTK